MFINVTLRHSITCRNSSKDIVINDLLTIMYEILFTRYVARLD